MFNRNLYLALDIGDLSAKAVQFKIGKKEPEIISYGAVEIPIGIVDNGEIKNRKEMSGVIQNLFHNIKGAKIKARYVGCSLPEEKSFVRLISLPPMSDKELKEAIKWAAETEIPLRLDELYLGWETIERHINIQPSSKEHIDVLLAASPKEIVDNYVNFLKDLNLTPILMEIESNLVVKSLIDFQKADEHLKANRQRQKISKTTAALTEVLLILDIGASRTNFIIFNGKTLYFTSTTEIAGNTLNEALAKALKTDLKQAEKIKKDFGLDKEEKQGEIFDALVPPITSLTEEINRVLDYYREHHAHEAEQLNISKIIVCGGGALLKGLAPHLQTALNLNVELGNPWINFNNVNLTKKNRLPIIPKEISLMYTTAIGISLAIKNEYHQI